MPDAANLQAEARKAEDAVSDALHERLTARFVDRRAAHLIRRLDDTEGELLSAVTRQGQVVVEGHTGRQASKASCSTRRPKAPPRRERSWCSAPPAAP